jgi:hypothetical protein
VSVVLFRELGFALLCGVWRRSIGFEAMF